MKRGLIFVLSVIFLISLVSSTNVELNVHTLPLHEVTVSILDPNPSYQQSWKTFPEKRTGFDGVLSVEATIDTPQFGLFIVVKKDGQTKFYERLENQLTAEVVDVYVLVDEDNPIVVNIPSEEESQEISQNSSVSEQEGEQNNEEVSDENTESDNSLGLLTGNVISNISSSGFSGLLYGVLVAVILVALVGFFIYKRAHSNHPALKSDDRPPTILTDKELEDTERRIKKEELELREMRVLNEKKALQKRYSESKTETKKTSEPSKNFSPVNKPENFQKLPSDKLNEQSNNQEKFKPSNEEDNSKNLFGN